MLWAHNCAGRRARSASSWADRRAVRDDVPCACTTPEKQSVHTELADWQTRRCRLQAVGQLQRTTWGRENPSGCFACQPCACARAPAVSALRSHNCKQPALRSLIHPKARSPPQSTRAHSKLSTPTFFQSCLPPQTACLACFLCVASRASGVDTGPAGEKAQRPGRQERRAGRRDTGAVPAAERQPRIFAPFKFTTPCSGSPTPPRRPLHPARRRTLIIQPPLMKAGLLRLLVLAAVLAGPASARSGWGAERQPALHSEASQRCLSGVRHHNNAAFAPFLANFKGRIYLWDVATTGNMVRRGTAGYLHVCARARHAQNCAALAVYTHVPPPPPMVLQLNAVVVNVVPHDWTASTSQC